MSDVAVSRPRDVGVPATAAVTDTLVIARRHLIRLFRTPQLLVSALIVPVMFLLMFRYIFALLLGQVLFWVFAAIGFGTANPETAASMTTPFMLFVIVSSAFVPVATLPGWLQGFARNQPISQFMDVIRCLTQGAPAVRVLGHPAGYFAVTSLLWGAAITLAGAVLALRAYRRL